jgi:hypothetical protein
MREKNHEIHNLKSGQKIDIKHLLMLYGFISFTSRFSQKGNGTHSQFTDNLKKYLTSSFSTMLIFLLSFTGYYPGRRRQRWDF